MNPSRSDNICYNCGRPNVSHIAMYCSEKPQQFLRCLDPNCWAACRDANNHLSKCAAERIASLPLGDSSQLHRPARRFTIETKDPILRYIIGTKRTENGPIGLNTKSAIADDISFKWESENKFEITGPKTMYFRVLIAVGRTIIARVDVGCESSDFIRVPTTPLDQCRKETKIHQTVAVLCAKAGKMEVEAGNKSFTFEVAVDDEGNAQWTSFVQKEN